MSANTPEPMPEATSGPAVWDLVIADMRERDHVGRAKYGVPLQAGNGRDNLVDAYQEALDLAVYLRAEIEERRGPVDSGLVRHAETELRLAGLYEKDSDYGGMIPENVVAVIRAFASAGHSGGSAALTSEIVCRLMRYKTLTPITSDPAEWMEVSAMCPPDQRPVHQNRRDSAMFSSDGGKTHYSVDDPARAVKLSAEPRK